MQAGLRNILTTASRLQACNTNLLKAQVPLVKQLENLHISSNLERRYRQIRGGGRLLPDHVPKPEPYKYRWKVIFPEDMKYTTDPLPVIKLAGRNEQGRVAVRTLGGGAKKKYRWVDNLRKVPEGMETYVEKVEEVRYSPCHSSRIALVAHGMKKRWITASQDMKVGDFITTHCALPRIPVDPKLGDAHPVGALPIGTMIHNVEIEPGKGGRFVRSSGSAAQVLRKLEDGMVVVKLPSKREISIPGTCTVVVGTVLDTGCKWPIGSTARFWWMGWRPKSGWWHRKDGYCGFKNRPTPPMKVYDKPVPPKPIPMKISRDLY